jgi:recombination protein RecA
MATGRDKALESALAELRKKYGDGAIMRLGESTRLAVEVIPTGSLALDIALGVGGIPRGRVTEIFGPESSGKTTLCQHIVAEAQKRGGNCAYIDMEHALDPAYAAKCGADTDALYVAQPDTGEQALEIAETLIRSGGVDMVVVDSVAALVPRAEIEGDMGDATMGMQARLMSQALRKLSAVIRQTNTAMIFTNQLRQKIGVMFGNPETTTGGMALKFYASVRLDVRRVQSIKNGSEVMGSRTRVRVVKSGDLIDIGTQLELINKRGAYFSFNDERIGQGRENAKQYLREHPEVMEKLEAAVREKAMAFIPALNDSSSPEEAEETDAEA